MDIQEAITLANIATRAKNLWDDGYTCIPNTTLSGVYEVRSPKGALYFVTCDEVLKPHCDCPAFEKYGECKHNLAVQWMVENETVQIAKWEVEQNNDDDRYPEC